MKNSFSGNRFLPFALFAVFFTSFSAYLAALNPAFFNDDSAETITAGFTLGLQHPPGYALATLVNRLFSFIPVGSPSFRINLGSAILSALAVTLLASLLFRFLRDFLNPNQLSANSFNDNLALATAVAAGLLSAFSKTWWEKSIGAKGGVYILGTVLVFVIWHLLLERERVLQKNQRLAFLSFFLFGLGLANHWETLVLFIPLPLVFLARNSPDQDPFPKSFRLLLPAFLLLGASPLLYLPLRSALHPALNLGAPESFHFFLADFFRTYYTGREGGLLATLFQVLNGTVPWEKFFSLFHTIMDTQGKQISIHLMEEMKVPTLLLALFGLAVWRFSGERRLWLVFLAPMALLFLSLCWASWIPPGPNAGWYTDVFLLPVNWMIPFLAAAGFYWLAVRFGGGPKTILAFLFFASIPLYLFSANFKTCDHKTKTIPYDYGVNLLKSLPKDSVFFAETDEDYFSLYYLQQAEKMRRDVKMIPAFILFEPWGVWEIEKLFPDLGLTASSQNFHDPLHRIIFSTSEIIQKNKNKNPCAFSFFEGAFHRDYLSRHPDLSLRRSGIVLELDSPAVSKGPWLESTGLRTRHREEFLSNPHPALWGIGAVYQKVGVTLF